MTADSLLLLLLLLMTATAEQEGYSKATVVCSVVSHLLQHSSAVRYYSWLAVGTAVHHLVLTYWQAGQRND